MNEWIRQNVTVPAVLALLALFASGVTYINQVRALESRVQQIEERLSAEHAANAATYSRRDVMDALLISINQRLANIESDVRDIKQARDR